MKLLINGIELNVNNAYAERDKVSGIITLFITVPYAEMGYESLKSLLVGNTDDIVKTSDDGSIEIFSGFAKPKVLDDDEAEIYTVTMTSAEYDFQLGRNRQLEIDIAKKISEIESKEMEIANMQTDINDKQAEIDSMANEISEKQNAIEGKDVFIAEQKEIIAEHEHTITDLKAEVEQKDIEIQDLLAIAEEYADILYEDALLEIESAETEIAEETESEVM